jgi:hypothetical protein
VIYDYLGQVVQVDNDFSDPAFAEPLDDVLQDRFATDRDHALGDVLGKRSEAGALAGGEDHGLRWQMAYGRWLITGGNHRHTMWPVCADS